MAHGAWLTVVLVDTTVWVDFFAGRDTSQMLVLEGLLQDGKDICICGFILT